MSLPCQQTAPVAMFPTAVPQCSESKREGEVSGGELAGGGDHTASYASYKGETSSPSHRYSA
eukprot:3198029-Pleurochrysis_carterae.AAC.2